MPAAKDTFLWGDSAVATVVSLPFKGFSNFSTVEITRIPLADPTRAHTRARLKRAPPVSRFSAERRWEAAPLRGPVRFRRQAVRRPLAAGCRHGKLRCQTTGRRAWKSALS